MLRRSKLGPPSNRFLAGLPDSDVEKLRPHLKPLPAKTGEVLYWHGDPTRYLYFPLDASVSLVTTAQEGRGVEVALIGWEGLVGICAALGSETNWHEAVVQVPGEYLRIKKEVFQAELKLNGALLDQLHRYMSFLLTQVSQTAACNRLHRLDQRLARWLLMTQDHAQTDEFPVTHEFLSRMVGADRSDVTLAAGILRKSGTISYSRGKVKVLERKGLERASCACYRILSSELSLLYQKIDPAHC